MNFDTLAPDEDKVKQPAQQLQFDSLPDDNAPVAAAPKFDDLPDDHAPKFDDLPDDNAPDKYSTPGQQALTMAENFGKGLSVGATTYAEQKLHDLGVPGLSNEDIEGRKKANPAEALYSDIGGNVVLSAMLPEIRLAQLGKVGATALKGAITSGLFQTGDEVADSLLNDKNPTASAVPHILAMTGLGLLGGAASPYVSKLGNAIVESKGTALKSFLYGLGHAAHFPESEIVDLSKSALTDEAKGLSNLAFKAGQLIYKNKVAATAGLLSNMALKSVGAPEIGGFLGHIEGGGIGAFVDKLFGKQLDNMSKNVIGNMLMKAASSGNTEGLKDILDAGGSIIKGSKVIDRGVEGLFSSVPQKMFGYDESGQEEIDKIKKHIEQGGVEQQIRNQEPQKFAEGGPVNLSKPDPMAEHFPGHNMMVNAAKMRVSNYLNSVRPMPSSTLTYDTDRKDPHKEHEYDRIVGIAAKPLSILKKIKKGGLIPKDIAALNAMYPEVHAQLSKKITERIMQGKLKGEKKPPYKVRQAMSLFLGSNLDSTLSQPNMAAAQAVFAQQKAQRAALSTTSLSKVGKNSQTAEQAREQRALKS